MTNRYLPFLDVLLVVFAAYVTFALRLGWLFGPYQGAFELYLVAAVLVKTPVFYAAGLYRRYWPAASVRELLAVVVGVSATLVPMVACVALGFALGILTVFPRSVVLIDWFVTLAAIGGVRFGLRVVAESWARPSIWPLARAETAAADSPERRVLIVGAGDAGTSVVREMQRNAQLRLRPIAFLDDDPTKVAKEICGLPVLGTTADLRAVMAAQATRAQPVQEVIIAMPNAGGAVIRTLTEGCRELAVPSRTIPSLLELLGGHVSVSRLRRVEIADLLSRGQIVRRGGVGHYLARATVVVTGAGGSIGREICRQVLHEGPVRLVLLGHGENSLFEAADWLRQHAVTSSSHGTHLDTVIADVRDETRIRRVFARIAPTVVLHAAAHKHVPLMEENPEEAVMNNCVGTQHVLAASLEARVQRFVMISTDKAVEPTSVMGASKRLAERLVLGTARQRGVAYAVVRFGNVLGSRGSVIPFFQQQIERGGPVTVTHPRMRRFFMTIQEAVYLVLHAGGLASRGELFVLNMGDPLPIVDLATDLIRLSGLSPQDIAIRFTGVRPGEKLEERLWEPGATVAQTENPDVLVVSEPEHWSLTEVDDCLRRVRAAAEQGDGIAIRAILADAIPTYVPTVESPA